MFNSNGTAADFKAMALTFMMAANIFRDAAEALYTAVSVDCTEFKNKLTSQAQAAKYTGPAGSFQTNAGNGPGFQGKANDIGTTLTIGKVKDAIQAFKTAAGQAGSVGTSATGFLKDANEFQSLAKQVNPSSPASLTAIKDNFKTAAGRFNTAAENLFNAIKTIVPGA